MKPAIYTNSDYYCDLKVKTIFQLPYKKNKILQLTNKKKRGRFSYFTQTGRTPLMENRGCKDENWILLAQDC